MRVSRVRSGAVILYLLYWAGGLACQWQEPRKHPW